MSKDIAYGGISDSASTCSWFACSVSHAHKRYVAQGRREPLNLATGSVAALSTSTRYSPVRETLARGAKLAELVAHHLLRDGDGDVVLAVVDHEAEADKVGDDRARARLCEDWRVVLERLLQRGEGGDVGTWGLVSGASVWRETRKDGEGGG